MINFPLLQPQDIEVKVKQVTKTGALLLLYKTARTDARILDETVGPMNWTDEYVEILGNLYCNVGVREDINQHFVFKMDCGIESEQADDNKYKAQSSDAFKRACSKWGIGRELYTSPQIWASVATEEKNDKWYLKDRTAKYVVTSIQYDEVNRVITALTICNARSGVEVFDWSLSDNETMKKKMNRTFGENEAVNATTGEVVTTEIAPNTTEQANDTQIQTNEDNLNKNSLEEKVPLKELISGIGAIVKNMKKVEGNIDKYSAIVEKVTGDKKFKCNAATEDQYGLIGQIYEELVALNGNSNNN